MMTMDLARRIADEALSAARAAGSKPLCVVVVDAGGVPIVLAREDGAGIARPALSLAKAEGALQLNMPTRTLAAFHQKNPEMHAILRETTGKALLPLAGGVLVKDAAGRVIGAVGVSGGDLQAEEAFVINATKAAGLFPDPSEP